MQIQEQFDGVESKFVTVKLPSRAWDFIAQEADLLERSQSEEVSQIVLASLMAAGMRFEPKRILTTNPHE